MTLQEKIELFFFDPVKSREEYIEFYKKVNPDRIAKESGRYRYSPLYLLLKDIRYCYGIGLEFNPIREHLNTAEFAGIVLLRIAFNNTVKRIYSGRFAHFAKKYMGIADPESVDAINLLRNALEHSYYSLSIIRKKDKVKIYFSLGYYDWIIKKAENWKRPYASEMYMVNPKRLFTSFEKGVRKLKNDISDPRNEKLRNNFQSKLSLDEWVIMG